MECFVPGRLLVAPETHFIEEYENEISERIGLPLSFDHSVEDILSGVVTLTGEGQTTAADGSERGRSGRFPDARLLPPDPKGLGPRRPVLASGHAVSA